MQNVVRKVKTSVLIIAISLLFASGLANANQSNACVDVALKEQWNEALRPCTEAAKSGDVLSQFMLGWMYDSGQGVVQEYKNAVYWYTMAAKQNDAGAQYGLGVMYAEGRGVKQSYAQAVHWFKQAAEKGFVDAQHNLGVMYINGHGVVQDFVRAHMWFNVAAVNGDERSIKGREIAANQMTQKQIAEAQKMATDCTAKNYKGC